MGELSKEELEKWKQAQLNAPQKLKSAIITRVTELSANKNEVAPLSIPDDDTPCADSQGASISILYKHFEESNDAKNETMQPSESIQD